MDNIYYCRFCNKEFSSKAGKGRHEWRCSKNPSKDAQNKWHDSINQAKSNSKCKCFCDFCDREFTNKSSKTLHQKYCKDNPNKETFIYKNHFTEDTLNKIRDAQKASWASGNRKPITRDKRSYAETYFDNIFTDACKEYFQIGYFLDYAWPDKMCYIEIDGEQHYYFEDRIQHDKERTINLSNIGWTCIARVRWSEFQKLSKLQKELYIESIKDGIKNIILVPDLKPTPSKKDKNKEEVLAKRLKQEEERDNRRQFILSQSDIDYTKFGWVTKLSKRLNMTSQALSRWIRRYMPDFYKKYGVF